MSKAIQFDVEARRKLRDGINALARAVVVTLGPKGRPLQWFIQTASGASCDRRSLRSAQGEIRELRPQLDRGTL